MKILILSCLMALTLVSLVGCCDDQKPATTTTSYDSSVSDSKSMQHR